MIRPVLYPVAHIAATATTPEVTAYAPDGIPRVPRIFTVYQRGPDGRTIAVHHVSYELVANAGEPRGDA